MIVLDLLMPIMDGWTLLGILKHDEALREIPVIAFSAVIDHDVPPAIATVRKGTVNPDVLLGIIERAARKETAAN